ncbi:hypothetical protein ADEAN_000156900 [Angomonas deanei]|uniref:Uncharacterized protein n=1 Tax=Angomonas deanei TaxID=59799 RepID=A0A7G2C3M6_9TRYP|nr:hypothetical protein ADEAN_000156900 [Angomonas deanei]
MFEGGAPPLFNQQTLFSYPKGQRPPTPADSAHGGTDRQVSPQEMTLKLIYHQQLAIQLQLSNMLSWMEQVDGRLGRMEALLTAAQGHPTNFRGSQPKVNASGIGGSSSCTPPGEEAGVADLSVESIIPPWNPMNRSHTNQPHPNITSSLNVSQLGRQENPLLSSKASVSSRVNDSTHRSVYSDTTRLSSQAKVAQKLPSSMTQDSTQESTLPERGTKPQPYLAPAATDREIPAYVRHHGDTAPNAAKQPQREPADPDHSSVVGTSSSAPKEDNDSRISTAVDPPKEAPHSFAEGDSLSDGYGSYESRQYIKKIGLL